MSKERILETIGQVKDEYIIEAAPKGLLKNNIEEKALKTHVRNAKGYRFIKWGALAACLFLIIGLGMRMNLFSNKKNDAAFEAEMKDSAMNQSAVTESVMEETTKGEYGYSIADTVTSAETPATDEGFPDWGLTLVVENVTSTGLTLVVTQEGGNPTGELNTGEPYRLIVLTDGTWKKVEELPLPEGVDGRGWNSMAYILPKGETRKFDINWEWMFGELPSGTYRLIKEFMDFRGTADYDTFEYWVEFNIK